MTTLTLPARSTLRAIRALSTVVDKSGDRPLMGTILLEQNGTQVTATATDSYRLATTTYEASQERNESILIPLRLQQLIGKVFNRRDVLKISENEVVTLHDDTNVVVLTCDGQSLSAPAVSGPFPNWRQLIPAEELTGEKVAWNPGYLTGITTLHQEMGWGRTVPVQLLASSTLRPSLFRMSSQGDSIDYLLMPVRMS